MSNFNIYGAVVSAHDLRSRDCGLKPWLKQISCLWIFRFLIDMAPNQYTDYSFSERKDWPVPSVCQGQEMQTASSLHTHSLRNSNFI